MLRRTASRGVLVAVAASTAVLATVFAAVFSAVFATALAAGASASGARSASAYVNPLREVRGLQASRIDMGVDYSGSGPILALGRAKVVLASDRLAGPESCWGKTCVPPPGDMIVYRLLDGRFAGKYVYVVENITIAVRPGQTVRAGEKIAILHPASPNLEIGWASGRGVQTLAAAYGHQCACQDPGGWSSVEGRNFDTLLVRLGAPGGYLTTVPPHQHMPRGWPSLPPRPRPSRG